MLTTEVRYFLAVIDAGSLSAASQHLFVATSAISRQIQQLEDKTGMPLFERHARGMTLTEAGRIFERHIRQSQQAMESTLSEMKGRTALQRTTINIACTDGLAWNLLPALCSVFRQQYPSVSFHLKVGNSSQVLENLNRGGCDLALQFCLHSERRVQVLGSWPAPIMAAMSAKHPLAERPFVLQDLSGYPIALPDHTTTVRQLFDLSCQLHGVFIEPMFTCNNFSSLYHFLKLNPLAITFCSQFTMKTDVCGLPFIMRNLFVNTLAERTLQLHQLPGRYQSASVRLFISFLQEALQQHLERSSDETMRVD